MPRLLDWLTAARPLAQANIALPLLFGQAVAWATYGTFDVRWLGYLLGFGLIDQLYIVFANDYADRDSDGAVRTPFSGGSGVLQSGRISASSLKRAAVAMGVALALLGLLAAPSRPLLVVVAALALALLHAYSFPPFRLSYRGGGEWLQALGVGALLPFAGYYAQTGQVDLPLWALAPSFLAGLAGNVLTAVPDVEQDARAGKRTVAVAHGEVAAMIACAALLFTAALLSILPDRGAPSFVVPSAGAALAVAIALGRGQDRRRARLLFVVLAGAVQQGIFAIWATALALSR